MSMDINIKDIAKAAGVSIATVSRTINNSGYVGDATRKRIEAVLENLGYVPNMIAKSLQQSKTRTIGMIVPNSSHNFYAQLIYEVETAISDLGLKLFICNSNNDLEREKRILATFSESRVDGLIIASHTTDDEYYKKFKIPIVMFDRFVPDDIPYVSSDNFHGGELAAQHLIDKGCRNLLHIGSKKDNAFNHLGQLRSEGFIGVAKKNNISAKIIEIETPFVEFTELYKIAEAETKDILKNYDGVFCSNDLYAYAIYLIATKRNLKIPEDLKIVGYDNSNFTKVLQYPKLTTIEQNCQEIANNLIEILFSEKNEKKKIVNVKLIKGTTT